MSSATCRSLCARPALSAQHAQGRLRQLPLARRGRRHRPRGGGAGAGARGAHRDAAGAARRDPGAHAGARGPAPAAARRRPSRRSRERLAGRRRGDRACSRRSAGSGWIVAPGGRSAGRADRLRGRGAAAVPGRRRQAPASTSATREAARLGIAPGDDRHDRLAAADADAVRARSRGAVDLRARRHLPLRDGPSSSARAALPLDRAEVLFGADRPRRLLVEVDPASRPPTRSRSGSRDVLPAGSRVSNLAGAQPAALLRPARSRRASCSSRSR